jgi:hypothetical protein
VVDGFTKDVAACTTPHAVNALLAKARLALASVKTGDGSLVLNPFGYVFRQNPGPLTMDRLADAAHLRIRQLGGPQQSDWF